MSEDNQQTEKQLQLSRILAFSEFILDECEARELDQTEFFNAIAIATSAMIISISSEEDSPADPAAVANATEQYIHNLRKAVCFYFKQNNPLGVEEKRIIIS